MVPRVVITGAPASGKTVFFGRLKKHPDLRRWVLFDELARLLLSENPQWRQNWRDFHIELYRRQVEREQRIINQPFITDRGTIDAFAFYPETTQAVGTSLEREYCRYSAVIHLGTAAALGNEFYQPDTIRSESITDVLEIEKALAGLWSPHPGYRFVAAQVDFEMKYRTFVETVLDVIGDWKQ